MNFTEAVNEVLDIVKRPDKLLAMRRQVNAAVNFFCSDSDFKRDVAEILLPISAVDYSQLIPFSSLPRYRKLQYIKRSGTSDYLDEIVPARMPTMECSIDKYYEAGTGIRINMSVKAANVDIGYWQYPPTLTDALDNNTHWMLDLSPYMVIDRAAGMIFSNIGDDASSKQHIGAASQAYLAFASGQKSAP